MKQNLNKQKKQILSDPVAEYLSMHPEANDNIKTRLIEFQQQKVLLLEQHKKTNNEAKVISRKIGDAKRNNQETDSLKNLMRELSSHIKRLSEQINEADDQILQVLKSDNHIQDDDEVIIETTSDASSASRQYTASIDDIENIVITLLDSEDDEWNTYVSKQPAATLHHLSEWRNLFKKTYGHESFYFLARDNNHTIVGILPLIRLKSRLFGDLLVSMPYFQRGGAIADHPLIEQKLMQSANKTAARLGIDHIEYRDDIPRNGLPSQDHKVNMVLLLPESKDLLWGSFSPKLRAQIKRPQQLSPKVVIGRKEILDDFYKVYTRNMRDLGSPAQSKLLIENILDYFPENSWIIVISLHNKPVSAGLLLGHGNMMEIPLASTIREANPHSMNMLLYWEVLKLAIKHGYKGFDFGRSSKNTGTYRFKQQWGAQPKQLYWHYWLGKTEELPSLNPSNPKYFLIINIWKRLPVMLTRWLGPLIVKNLP